MRDDRFEWDDRKAAINRRDHGVTFDEARAAFDDPNGDEEDDDDPDERRWRLIASARVGILFVVFTERDGRIRIISARRATTHEQNRYRRQARP